MTVPLMVLAGLAVVAGLVNLPFMGYPLENFLLQDLNLGAQPHGELWLAAVSLIVAGAGIFLAYMMYFKKSISAENLANSAGGAYNVLSNKYYLDELYIAVFVRPTVALGRFLWEIDKVIVDGIVNLIGKLSNTSGATMEKAHNGQLQTYGVISVIGGIVIIALAFVLGGYLG